MRFAVARFVVVIGLAASASAALAQSAVWRCDGQDGTRYSSQPCDDGRMITVGDRQGAERLRQAREVADRERRLLATLVAERTLREKTAPMGAAGIGDTARKTRSSLPSPPSRPSLTEGAERRDSTKAAGSLKRPARAPAPRDFRPARPAA